MVGGVTSRVCVSVVGGATSRVCVSVVGGATRVGCTLAVMSSLTHTQRILIHQWASSETWYKPPLFLPRCVYHCGSYSSHDCPCDLTDIGAFHRNLA